MTIQGVIEAISKATRAEGLLNYIELFDKAAKELNRLEPVKTNMSRITNVLQEHLEHLYVLRVLFCLKGSPSLKRGWVPILKWKIEQIKETLLAGRKHADSMGDIESVKQIDEILEEIERDGKKGINEPPAYESLDVANQQWGIISADIRKVMTPRKGVEQPSSFNDTVVLSNINDRDDEWLQQAWRNQQRQQQDDEAKQVPAKHTPSKQALPKRVLPRPRTPKHAPKKNVPPPPSKHVAPKRPPNAHDDHPEFVDDRGLEDIPYEDNYEVKEIDPEIVQTPSPYLNDEQLARLLSDPSKQVFYDNQGTATCYYDKETGVIHGLGGNSEEYVSLREIQGQAEMLDQFKDDRVHKERSIHMGKFPRDYETADSP